MKTINYKDVSIVAISDTHGYHELFEVPECDILIHAGDFSKGGSVEYEILGFTDWLKKQPAKHKILVPGHHDIEVEEDRHRFHDAWDGVNLLLDESIQIMGINILGSPWVTQFMNWAFMKTEEELEEMYSKFTQSEIDILVTHGPAYGILDECEKKHLGSKALLKYMNKLRPDIHIHGHIHEAAGSNFGRWNTHNVSVAEKIYKMKKDNFIKKWMGLA